MARKKTSTRAPSPRSRRPARSPGKPHPVRQRVVASARWSLRASRPRSATELLALILVVFAAGTLASAGVGWLVTGQRSGADLFWCLLLLVMALAARAAPWWQMELRGLTRERARSYLGSAILVYIVLSLSWHVVTRSLGLSEPYLLMGPASRGTGANLTLTALALLAIVLLAGLPVVSWSSAAVRFIGERMSAAREPQLLEAREVKSLPLPKEPDEPERQVEGEDSIPEPPQTSASAVQPGVASEPHIGSGAESLPPVDLFVAAPKGPAVPLDLDLKAQRIQETLASFNVGARVVGRHSGPVVTQFDVQPDRGVKVRRITELQNDLALALSAPTIRIQAPVPGKPVVGIEIPNSAATLVTLRELLESDEYRAMSSPLRVALGKDVAGKPVIIDLARMPHLLIAGATGSGKSACINDIISCLLYQSVPDQVRIMMIDPKMVELTVYNGVPHLLSPVITQMDRVVGVLQWAIREMERRYQLFADHTVRNIQRFNEKAEARGDKKLPYLVLIVDELADLMMVAPEDVEDAICRLAQLARAAGIHLVIATQRPSVDVVTGLIKANFPARIAFAMSSQVDSRTILDAAGAEKLLGRGDMLYMPPDAPKPFRLQGAYVSDTEVERLVEFWQRTPLHAPIQTVSEEELAAAQKAAKEAEDELLGEATAVVREYQHASVSLLQRRLKIGYARAARLMDQLEAHGVVAPADGSKQRAVLDENNSIPH